MAPGRVARTKLLDQSACAVIRWMQSQGWDFAKCRKALYALGATAISDQTIRCQLTGKRGDPATLTKEQTKKLNDAAK